MAFVVHREARLERLIDTLAAAPAPADPFICERIVVSSRASAQPLLAALAVRRGVAAHIETPTLEAFLSELDEAVHAAATRPPPAGGDALLHAVLQASLRLRGTPAFASVGALHREGPESDVVDAALLIGARRLSAAFLRYAASRPSLLEAWEAGEEPDDWQATLWRAVRGIIPGPIGASRWDALAETLRRCAPPLSHTGPVRILGHQGMGRAALNALEALGAHVDVEVFMNGPAPEPGPLQRLVRRLDPEGAALTERALASAAPPAWPPTVLGALQALLDGQQPTTAPDAPDDSLQLLRCSDAREQVECVRDALLDLLDADPTLEPHDILVMTPAMDRFAPWIDAIFEEPLPAAPGGAPPPTLRPRPVDLPGRRRSPLSDALAGALELAGSRAELDTVVRFLSRPVILEALDLDDDDLRRCRRWFEEAAIRWGRDARHRSAFGQPAIRLHTWRHGFDRLLLGHALPDADPTAPDPFEQLAPVAGLDGSDAALLGRCIDLLLRLFDAFDAMREPAPMTTWRDRLTALARDLVGAHPDASTHLQDVLGALAELPDTGPARLDLDALRAILDETLREPRPLPSFQAGGVRIAALAPGRAQPCRVLVLLGLDPGALTRRDPAAFDRLALSPRDGDPPRAASLHVALLEAILAARGHLLVSWGSPQGQKEAPDAPAAPLEAILRELRRHLPPAARPTPRDALSRPRWAAPPAVAMASDAAAVPWPRGAPVPRAPASGGPRGERDVIDLAFLASLFASPHRVLLRDVLGFRLVRPEARPTQREPLSPDALDLFAMGERLTHLLMLGVDAARAHRILAAEGRLPPGLAGEATFRRVLPLGEALARAVSERIDEHAGARERPFPVELARQRVDLHVGERRLVGAIEGLLKPPPADLALPPLRLAWRYGRLRVQDEIRLWIEHLALTLSTPRAPVSVFFGRSPDRSGAVAFVELPPLPRALAYRELVALVALHERHVTEVPDFYPATGRAFVSAIERAKQDERPVSLRAAEATWYTPNGWREAPKGDGVEPEGVFLTAAARGDGYPFNSMDFRETSLRLFTPLGAWIRHGRR